MEKVTGSIVKVNSSSSAQKNTGQDESARFGTRIVQAENFTVQSGDRHVGSCHPESSSRKRRCGSLADHPSVKSLKREDLLRNAHRFFRGRRNGLHEMLNVASAFPCLVGPFVDALPDLGKSVPPPPVQHPDEADS